MIRWVLVESEPARQFHDARARPYVDPTERADEILVGVGSRRSDVNGEVPNAAINLANRDFEASRALAADPPLAVRAAIIARAGEANVEQYAGVVESISLSSAGATIEVRA